MGIVTAKYADQSSGYNQLLHVDYPNHMLVVPRHEPRFQQVEFFVYLTDVDRRGRCDSLRVVAEDEAHPGRAAHAELRRLRRPLRGPVGGLGSGRLGRGVPTRRLPPVGRPHRPDAVARHAPRFVPTPRRGLGGYQAWPFRGFSFELSKYVQQATPRQLALLGVPEPGQVAYWNQATLAGVQARYPGLDMGPWRRALAALKNRPPDAGPDPTRRTRRWTHQSREAPYAVQEPSPLPGTPGAFTACFDRLEGGMAVMQSGDRKGNST